MENKKSELNQINETETKDKQLWRDLVGFWIIGLCNNYGSIVILSAAHDILEQFNHNLATDAGKTTSGRNCNIVSTGTILIADFIPSLLMKISSPFIPFWINVRVFCSIAMSVSGFILVGLGKTAIIVMLGVLLISANAGLGETTFLAYSASYNKNVISAWASGTGAAGLFGSISYAALKSFNIAHSTIMFIMLAIPTIECFAFLLILRRPINIILRNDNVDGTVQENELNTFIDKLKYIVHLLKYMIPLMTVYFAVYFINQGLYELVFFENIFLDHQSQYRWFNVGYRIAAFISRSTVNLHPIDHIWILSVLQIINVLYFLFEVLYYITPSIWIVFVIVLWEGLLGGGAYVHTYYKISKDIPPARRRFALGIVSVSDTSGIAMAGFTSIRAHNVICQLPIPTRHYW